MKNNRAFTLIEVMVVLSILAIIAILAYNFFGGTMKEAKNTQTAVKIYNDLRTISDAAELYAIDNGGALPVGNSAAVKALLLDGGYLKAWPAESGKSSPGTSSYTYFNGYDPLDGVGANDDIIFTSNYSDEVCAIFAEKYGSAVGTLQSAQWDYQGAGNTYPGVTLGKGARVYGIKWSTADVDRCEIEWVMKYND